MEKGSVECTNDKPSLDRWSLIRGSGSRQPFIGMVRGSTTVLDQPL
jgi:hypothetical protein